FWSTPNFAAVNRRSENQLIFYFLPTPKTQKIGKKQKFNFSLLNLSFNSKIYLALNICLYIELRIKFETILLN
ncbi:hypothetical protein, partial [Globicatella sanguinis]|uniref:hypothetical protein n=1 Tax=Globicatella sanguinis TaxID=13076 RepID=UPI001C3F3913